MKRKSIGSGTQSLADCVKTKTLAAWSKNTLAKPEYRTLEALARDGHAKDRPNSLTVGHLAWGAACSVQPVCKVH